MKTEITILIILIVVFLILLNRAQKAFIVSLYIIQNHTKLAHYLPDYENMIFSLKPLNPEYWLNKCILKYAKSNQE